MNDLPNLDTYSKIGNMPTTFAEALKAVLTRRGMTPYRLAKDAGLTQGYMGNLIHSRRSPTSELMERLAAILTPEEIADLNRARAQDLLVREGIDVALSPAEDESRTVEATGETKVDARTKLPPRIAAKLKKASQVGKGQVEQPAVVMEPILASQLRRLPVFGDVACGWGGDVPDQPLEWQDWPDIVAKDADHIIRVRGDSMQDVGITPDTLVFVRKAPKNWRKEVPPGRRVVARYKDDSTYTCKILGHVPAGKDIVMTLQGAGPGFERPISEFERPFEVIGIVVGTYRSE